MYSQQQEEVHILETLKDIDKGLFLDIGAWNAKTFSNTRALYEKGWSGTLVEPSPGPLRGLLEEYGNEERIRIVSGAAVGALPGLTQMWISDDALSTSEEPEYEKWKPHATFIGRLWVPNIPLRWLINDDRGAFDFVSIDTEGTSVDLALEMIRTRNDMPLCISVEHNNRINELMVGAAPFYNMVHANDTNVILRKA